MTAGSGGARAPRPGGFAAWAAAIAVAFAACAVSPAPARAQAQAQACANGVGLDAVRAYAAGAAQTAAAPVTGILPSSDQQSAAILFHQAPATGPAAPKYYLIEADDATLRPTRATRPLTVLSVHAAPDDAPPELKGFAPTDSVEILADIPTEPNGLWPARYFVVVSCVAGSINGWGVTTAKVSDPATATGLCLLAAVLIYALGIAAVMRMRGDQHVLNAKYPAIFGDRPMTAISFLNPIHLTTNAFNQASVQKLQVLVFSFLVGSLLLQHVLRTGALVGLSVTVVGLLGVSGVGAAAAQFTYHNKTRLSFDNWAWLQQRGVVKSPDQDGSTGPKWRDLVMTSREFDVYKLQTIIFSIAVACEILVAGSSQLQNFSVPPALLGVLGLSQVVYVGGVLAAPPTESDLDDALTKLRKAGETVAAAKTQGTDTDRDGKLLPGAVAPDQVAANAQRQYDDLADIVIPMIETTLEVEADRSKL
jgi:hypothetical protein